MIESLETEEERAVIPTTFIPLAPDQNLDRREIDVLFGLFHIMWKDMPKPRTYPFRLSRPSNKTGKLLGLLSRMRALHESELQILDGMSFS